jgi:hypothetical protein
MKFRTFNARANGSESPCKVPRLWKASRTYREAVRKPEANRDETKTMYPFIRRSVTKRFHVRGVFSIASLRLVRSKVGALKGTWHRCFLIKGR